MKNRYSISALLLRDINGNKSVDSFVIKPFAWMTDKDQAEKEYQKLVDGLGSCHFHGYRLEIKDDEVFPSGWKTYREDWKEEFKKS